MPVPRQYRLSSRFLVIWWQSQRRFCDCRSPLEPHARPNDLVATERRVISVPEFDAHGVFDDDYLYFFADDLEERSGTEADIIWDLLDLERGMEVLDLACGHGRIANRIAQRGCHVTGLDATPIFLQRARADADALGVTVEYVERDMRGYLPSVVHERNGDLVVDQNRLDPLTSHSIVTRTVMRGGTMRQTRFFTRLFTFPELRDWLLSAGFRAAAGYGEDGNPLTAEHRRLITVAEL